MIDWPPCIRRYRQRLHSLILVRSSLQQLSTPANHNLQWKNTKLTVVQVRYLGCQNLTFLRKTDVSYMMIGPREGRFSLARWYGERLEFKDTSTVVVCIRSHRVGYDDSNDRL